MKLSGLSANVAIFDAYRNDGQHEQFLARNHHAAIIDKELFDAVQAARLVRTNVTVDEDGNRVRKSTKYSSKHKK